MIVNTGAIIYLLGATAMVAAFGVYFARKARQGWLDSNSADDVGGHRWVILSGVLALVFLTGSVRLAYDLALLLN